MAKWLVMATYDLDENAERGPELEALKKAKWKVSYQGKKIPRTTVYKVVAEPAKAAAYKTVLVKLFMEEVPDTLTRILVTVSEFTTDAFAFESVDDAD